MIAKSIFNVYYLTFKERILIMIDNIIVVRGGGDLATGVIQKFHRSGFNVLVTETANPTAIRRTVALSEAVYAKVAVVEDVKAEFVSDLEEAIKCFEKRIVPIIIDEECNVVKKIKPLAVIDGVIAKKNLGTNKNMADITIALGPGFIAGEDVDAVIETMRGHDLGRLILSGSAKPNTGIPGEIGGKSAQRVIHAPMEGYVKNIAKIGSVVQEGETVLEVDTVPYKALFTGLVRGLIRDGIYVRKGMKIGDIDPRTDVNYHTISDKARTLGGAALEAYFYLKSQKK